MDAGGFRGTGFRITDICTSTEPRPGRGGLILARREMTGAVDQPNKKWGIGLLELLTKRYNRTTIFHALNW
jgi:hypothetical protein